MVTSLIKTWLNFLDTCVLRKIKFCRKFKTGWFSLRHVLILSFLVFLSLNPEDEKSSIRFQFARSVLFCSSKDKKETKVCFIDWQKKILFCNFQFRGHRRSNEADDEKSTNWGVGSNRRQSHVIDIDSLADSCFADFNAWISKFLRYLCFNERAHAKSYNSKTLGHMLTFFVYNKSSVPSSDLFWIKIIALPSSPRT